MGSNIANIGLLQEFSLIFYMRQPDRRGLGAIWAKYRVGRKIYRINTNLKGKKDYWDESLGELRLRRDSMSRIEWISYSAIQKELDSIANIVGEKIEYYICSRNPISPETVGLEIAKLINSNFGMPKKKTISTGLISRLKTVVDDYPNKKTVLTYTGIVSTFSEFMKEKNISDDVSSMGMDLMKKWREWLINSDLSVSRQKDCLNIIFTLAKKVELRYNGKEFNLDFQLDKSKIEPIKDTRSTEERRENGIALTHDEIEKFRNVDLSKKPKLIPARDMFLVQCWCGCRVEDLVLLLDSKNITQVQDGHYYSIFRTQKKGVQSSTPLDSLYPEAYELVLKYKDNCPFKIAADFRKYNRHIKEIATLAGLDREITYIGQKGSQKYEEVNKLYEVISSHDGRHSFITNCIRDKGLTPDKIIYITGHTDTTMIERIYANLTQKDKINQLSKAISETKNRVALNNDDRREGKDPGSKSSDNESPVKFCLWLMKELGIDPKTTVIAVPELMEKIRNKKQEIISKYGQEKYEKTKKFLGVGLGKSDKKRLEILFCKALEHKVKLRGDFPRKI